MKRMISPVKPTTRLQRMAIFLITVFLTATIVVPAASADNFTLKDQFNNSISVQFPAGKPVVLVFGDREGAEQVEGWVRPIYTKFTDKIYIYGIAELSAVPSALRPVVRRIIKNKSDNPIMLDWSGAISKSYGCEKGRANVFVINPQGEIIATSRGAADTATLNELYGKINSLF